MAINTAFDKKTCFRSSTTQPWQVSVFPTSMTSTPPAFPPCPGICTCAAPLPQFVAPTSLGEFDWSERSEIRQSFKIILQIVQVVAKSKTA